MAFQSAPEVVEVTLQQRQGGAPVINRFNIRVFTTPTTEILENVADIVDGWITTALAGNHPSTFFYDQIVVKDMETENGEVVTRVPTTLHGTSSGTAAANNAASTVSFRTHLTGRNYRGRFYMGGLVTASFTDATHISDAAASGILATLQALLDAIEAGTYELVVVSRWLANAKRVLAVAHAVTTLIVNTVVDSQQRRTGN